MQSLEFIYGAATRRSCEWENNPFGDFRKPNEGNPQNIKKHLERAWNQEGVAVVTGFQRAFFHLLFSNQSLCKGLVIRDINPQIVGASHFNILLLRIAEDITDYAHLSSDPSCQLEIKGRITTSDIPELLKKFYLKHFESLASAYYGGDREWQTSPSFKAVHYHQNQHQFELLQSYAKAGNIIATLGDIGDLSFLNEHAIVVIDTSNISDSQLMDIRCSQEDIPPTLIWSQVGMNAKFRSMEYHPLSIEERKKMDRLISFVHSAQGGSFNPQEIIFYAIGSLEHSPMVYSKETFVALKKYAKDYLVRMPQIGWISLSPMKPNIHLLNTLIPSQMDTIQDVPGIEKHLHTLVRLWNQLDISIYAEFAQIPGWKEAFFSLCEEMKESKRFENHFASFPPFQEFRLISVDSF